MKEKRQAGSVGALPPGWAGSGDPPVQNVALVSLRRKAAAVKGVESPEAGWDLLCLFLDVISLQADDLALD